MKNIIVIGLLILLFLVSGSFAYYYGTQQGKTDAPSGDQTSHQTTQPPEQPEQIVSLPISDIPSGWETYSDEQYGFKISFPSSYRALNDKENLYGWPNGIVLIYAGGQSYDLAIEHWNTQSEYENKYKNQSNITVKKINNFYITLLNANFDPEVDKIIKTFKITSFNQ